MNQRLLIILTVATLLSTVITSCQWLEKPPEHKYSKEELLEDFDYLTTNLSKLVPSIGLYTNKQSIDKDWQQLRSSIQQPMTDIEFFPILKEAVAQVEEGHIYLSGWGDEDSHVYQRLTRDKAGILPIQMRVLNDGLYVWQNRSHSDIAPSKGARVMRINGETAEYLIETLSQKIAMDANISNGRLTDLDWLFHLWYYLLHDQPDQFSIETLSTTGETETFEFQAVSIQEQNQYRIERYGKPESRPPLDATNFYDKEIWQEQNALYLNVFSYHSSLLMKHEVKPREFWQMIFNEMATNKLTNLVIDVRENRGGRNEFVWGLLSHINQNKLEGVFSRARSYDGQDHGTKLVFEIPEYDESKVFRGKIYALINGNTYSNGSMTAMALKEFANATLIGSETASRYMGFAASSWRDFNLPNTDIPLRVPFFVTEYPVAKTQTKLNAGVLPDIEVHPSIHDLMTERDVIKEMIIDLLSQ